MKSRIFMMKNVYAACKTVKMGYIIQIENDFSENGIIVFK